MLLLNPTLSVAMSSKLVQMRILAVTQSQLALDLCRDGG